MGTTLAALRAALRQDLRDEDAPTLLWPDPVLNRHLRHALRLVEEAAPLFVVLFKTMPSPAARRLDLAADLPPTFLWLDAVEYPLDRQPQSFQPFRAEPGPKLYLLGRDLPPPGAELAVWYARGYAVEEATSDLPPELDPVVLAGAAAHALTDQAVDTVDRLTPLRTPEAYRRLGHDAQDRFERRLTVLRARVGSPRWRVSWLETTP